MNSDYMNDDDFVRSVRNSLDYAFSDWGFNTEVKSIDYGDPAYSDYMSGETIPDIKKDNWNVNEHSQPITVNFTEMSHMRYKNAYGDFDNDFDYNRHMSMTMVSIELSIRTLSKLGDIQTCCHKMMGADVRHPEIGMIAIDLNGNASAFISIECNNVIKVGKVPDSMKVPDGVRLRYAIENF